MKQPFQTEQIAAFADYATFKSIPPDIIDQLKKHLLDSIGSFIHALPRPAIGKLYRQIQSISEGGKCKAPVLGNIAVDRAAQLYTALIRYPDFMDNFLGKEATCHPSDNIGGLLAVAQVMNSNGEDFLTAMALGYAIQCRMIEEIPVMKNGFDHTTLLAYSLTAACCKLLHLEKDKTAHALGIAGCAFDPMVTCRASYTYEWKGFASSTVAGGCMNIILLAKEGLTGPLSFFDGPKGFKDIHSMELTYDWMKEDFSLVRKCILKSYNSEVHTQSVIEAVLELVSENKFDIADIEEIDITTFITCYHIVGGGEYGDRHTVYTKEQADHSLPYLVAVAITDKDVYPGQFLPSRINSEDVQQLLKKVKVHTLLPLHKPKQVAGLLDPYTAAYPEKLKAKVVIRFNEGNKLEREKEDYYGFHTRPFSWEYAEEKFRGLSAGVITRSSQDEIIGIIRDIEKHGPVKLMELLGNITIKPDKE
jgi:2-methylcitrate dehydratase